MATTVASVIDRILDKARSRDAVDVLNGSITNVATTLTYTGVMDTWAAGSVIEIEAEQMLVTAVNTSTKVATIVRGWNGTTAASHADQLPIYIDPRYDRDEVFDLVNDCLHDMATSLFAVGVKEISYNTSKIGYDLDSTVVEVLRVDARMNSTTDEWKTIGDWVFQDNANTTTFASGKAIMMRTSLPTQSVFRVIYSKDFTAASAESDDLEAASGLADYMTDLPYYYALSRLLASDELLRAEANTAAAHQRAQDVPPTTALRTSAWYGARYEDRLKSCMARQTREVKKQRASAYGGA